MKKKCNRVDITDPILVNAAVYGCLNSIRKRRRPDTIELTMRVLNCNKSDAILVLKHKDRRFDQLVYLVSNELILDIKNENLKLPAVQQRIRIDECSLKERCISILNIRHFLFEYIAVYAILPLFKRIGEYLVSAIKGRGAGYGAKAIKRWLLESRHRMYAVKLDIKNFYGSVDKQQLLSWLSPRIGNAKLLWLIELLLYTIKDGMPIGSFLSLTLANLYLSVLYHYAMELTGGVIKHSLFYMDDMLFLGTNKRKLKKSVKTIIVEANKLKLNIKSNWNVYIVTKDNPIDMMGYRFCKECTTIRKRIFKPGRRAIIRSANLYRLGKNIPSKLAKRAAAYYGYFKNSDSCKVLHNILGEVKITDIFKYANKI